jgi:hypothetical protein
MGHEAHVDPAMPFDAYLAHESFGSSDLHAFRAGPPAMVPWRREHRDDGTSATTVGRAAHCSILTPALFERTFVGKPEAMSFSTKEGKAARAAWRAAGLTILTHDEMQTVQDVRRAFEGKPAARISLSTAQHREASVFWTDRDSELPCKARPDWFDRECIYDLKVSRKAESGLDSIRFEAVRAGWFHQLAHGRAGLNKAGYHKIKLGRLVVIAPKPPQAHRVWLLEVRESDMDFLELANENTRREMSQCWRRNDWPGTPDEWQQVELPITAAFNDSDLEGAEEASNDG